LSVCAIVGYHVYKPVVKTVYKCVRNTVSIHLCLSCAHQKADS